MDLKFDETVVDTSLAEEFLEDTEVSKFLSSKEDLAYDGKSTKLHTGFRCSKLTYNKEKLLELAANLETKTDLIAQLEYHCRQIPLEVTKVQVTLLIQYIEKICSSTEEYWFGVLMSIRISKRVPLLIIGMSLCSSTSNVLYCDKETKAICCLFSQIWPWEYRRYIKCIDDGDDDVYPEVVTSGTIGVVTQHADVDSAVDTFISSTRMVPWELRRILVQENVYQQFKEALSWKCNLNKKSHSLVAPQVACAETMSYNDKVFVIDPVQAVDDALVTVEAYRTNKELLSLLAKNHVQFVSLWANSVEEINEISYAVECSIVWINNLGDIRGPPQVSEAIFSMMVRFPHKNNEIKSYDDEAFNKLASLWAELSVSKRIEILKEVIPERCSQLRGFLNQALSKNRDHEKQSFVHVGKDYVCTGIEQLSGNITCYNMHAIDDFISLIRGNAILLLRDDDRFLIQRLLRYGVPVTMFHSTQIFYPFDFTTKVVWSNKGTIFAN